MTTPEIQEPDNLTLDQEIAAMALASEEPIEGLEQAESETPTDAPADAPALGPEGGAAFEPPVDGEAAPPAEAEAEPVDEVAKLKSENAQLVRDAEQRKVEATVQKIDADARQLASDYEKNLVQKYGWSEEQAKLHADSERRAYIVEQQLGMERKDNLARRLSQEHGVPVASLMAYNSAEEMTQAATQMGPRDREFQKMQKRIVELEKARIPVQNFNQAAGRTASTNHEHDLDQYNAGVRTPETEAAAKRNMGF